MSRFRVPLALVASLLAGGLAARAGAQGTNPACTTPLDPNCNHLKCYQIKDTPIVGTVPQLLQVNNQFGPEAIFRLQPVFLCLPTQKACCNATGCSATNCPPNPVPAPGLPHFKCYRMKVKSCTDPNCTNLAKFARGKLVNLRDQFGLEQNVAVGAPKLFCAPVDKQVVGQPTTSTTTSTTITQTTTTTTTLPCHFDPAANACSGPCPPGSPPGSQCQLTGPGKCDCVRPPVCCQCTGSAGPVCFDTNNPCPAPCTTAPNATCDSNTGQCGCGFCRDPASPTGCSTISCSTSQPCPSGLVCDPVHCPTPCDPCSGQTGTCNAVQCIRTDGTVSQCHPVAGGSPCGCCGPPNAPCLTDAECCSNICNSTTQSCQ